MKELLSAVRTPLFDGIDLEGRCNLMGCVQGHVKDYPKGATIVFEEEQVRYVGLLLTGAVDMIKEDFWGSRTLLMRMGPGQVFGETFAWGDQSRSAVTFAAAENTRVLLLSFHKMLHTCTNDCLCHQRLSENMVRIIAEKNRELIRKVELLSKRTLREKLLAYLSQQAQVSGSAYFDVPLSRQELAQYLNADRSAMTRELSRMREEGLLDFDGRCFRLL